MFIQCECGQFKAELVSFPKNSPGRLGCYCDDCQSFLKYLNRTDLMDASGRTEVVPVYPSAFKMMSGRDQLRCLQLSPKGIFRWYTSCCNTPIGNTRPRFPWVGLIHRVFTVKDTDFLEKTFGKSRSSIKGKFARGPVVEGTAKDLDFNGFRRVFPFLFKGLIMGRAKNSPFFEADGVTPIVKPKILSLDERTSVLKSLGF